jgi:hypothetical protein
MWRGKKKIIIINELKVLRNKRFGFVQLCGYALD